MDGTCIIIAFYNTYDYVYPNSLLQWKISFIWTIRKYIIYYNCKDIKLN